MTSFHCFIIIFTSYPTGVKLNYTVAKQTHGLLRFHFPHEAIQMRKGSRRARKMEYTVTVPTQTMRHAPSMAAALATRRLSTSFLTVLQN